MMEIYLVGGAVRDRLLNIPSYDRDWVVVGADADQMSAQGYRPVGKDFPVFLHPRSKEEYALARTERKSGHGYKGFEFQASPDVSLEQDLKRRDLTINAMAEDSDGNIIDPWGGREDLEKRLLRHVSEAFSEDPLRVLRVARFAARFNHLGFRVAPETVALMTQISRSGELEHLTRERVWNELERALAERSPAVFFQLLEECQALPQLFPELKQLLAGPTGEAALQALQCSARLDAPAPARLATLCSFLPPAALKSLIGRLSIPKESRDLCLLTGDQIGTLLNIGQLDPEQRLRLFETLDLQRRPERLSSLLDCARARTGVCQPGAPFAPEQALRHLLEIIATIQPRDLAAAGFKGKALGTELRRRRLAAIENGQQP